MSEPTALVARVRRAIDAGHAAMLAELAPSVCRFVVDHPGVAEALLAGQPAALDAALPRLACEEAERRLAIAELRNAIASVAAGATANGDQLVRTWLTGAATAALPPAQRVRIGFAALALEDHFLAAQIAADASRGDDATKQLLVLLHALVGELTGPRHPVLYRLGTTTRMALRRFGDVGAVDAGTLLWIGCIVGVGVLQAPHESSASRAAWKLEPWHDDAGELAKGEAALREPPFGERIGRGFTVTERVQGIGTQQLWLACDGMNRAALVAVDGKLQRQTFAELRAELRDPSHGGVELIASGMLDSSWIVAETCGDSEWLPAAIPRVQDPASAARMAIELGASAGTLVLRAAAAGNLMVRLRPEYMWVTDRDDRWEVTGVSDNADRLFALRAYTLPTHPLFDRHYYAPEHRQAPSERSLVYTLAVMIAEWAMGRYPFHTRWAPRGLELAAHSPLVMPAPLRELLEAALQREPLHRPALSSFVASLSRLR